MNHTPTIITDPDEAIIRAWRCHKIDCGCDQPYRATAWGYEHIAESGADIGRSTSTYQPGDWSYPQHPDYVAPEHDRGHH